MSEIEKSHAEAFLLKQNISELPPPSFRARALNKIGKIFGYNYILGVLMDTEKGISNAVINAKNKNKLAITGSNVAKFESRHHSVGGNVLRAAVLGGNDGLVSNFSLVMGIAGATAGGGGVL